jgi:hypothetical protein
LYSIYYIMDVGVMGLGFGLWFGENINHGSGLILVEDFEEFLLLLDREVLN